MKITKLNYNGRSIYENTAIAKLNEVIDAINDHKQQLNNHLCRLLALEDPDEPEQTDPYAEQRKWIGKLCWVWDDDDDARTFAKLTEIIEDDDDRPFKCFSRWKHCEPVKPDDDIIYKGE